MDSIASPKEYPNYTQNPQKSLMRRIWRSRIPYLFILPFYIGFLILDLFPILFSGYLSFQSWSGFGKMRFVGLQNYVRALADDRFINSLKITAILWLGHIFILLLLAFILALLMDSKLIKGRIIYRAIYYLPNVTPIAAMALVFQLIFDTNFGILNMILHAIGLPNVPWLIDPNWARVSVILLNLWGATGWYMLILLAGLQSVELNLYDAAHVDGANTLQRIWHITLPSIRNILFFCFVIETLGSAQMFVEPRVLTTGGPMNATLTTSLYLYSTAFEYGKFGYSAAMSFIFLAIILIASLIQLRYMSKEQP